MVNTLCLCQSIQCMPVSIKLYLMCEAGSTLYTYISHYFMFAAVKPCTPAEINVLYAWNWSIHYVWSDQYAVCLHSTSVNILDLHQSISCTPAEINVPYAWSWSIHYVWSNQYTVCLHSTSVNILGLHQSIPCTPSKSMYHMPGVGQYTKCETIRTLNASINEHHCMCINQSINTQYNWYHLDRTGGYLACATSPSSLCRVKGQL